MAGKSKKKMDIYREKEARRSRSARVMAIVMIFLMVAFSVLTAGIFLLD